MATRKLQRTDVLIVTVVSNGASRESTALTFTLESLNLSLRFVAAVVSAVAALFTTTDRVVTATYRLLFDRVIMATYRLLFAWLVDELVDLWIIMTIQPGEVYVRAKTA